MTAPSAHQEGSSPPAAVAVVVVREGRVPAGADEAVAEAGGEALVVGTGAAEAAAALPSARRLRAGEADVFLPSLARALEPHLAGSALVVVPASPDGRDLAPLLAAATGRRLLAGAVRAEVVRAASGGAGAARAATGGAGTGWAGAEPDRAATEDEMICAELLRADGQVTVGVGVPGPAVVTLWPGAGTPAPAATPPAVATIRLDPGAGTGSVRRLRLVEPDPATMDLADARRVLAGGAGLVRTGAPAEEARAVFSLLVLVARALGASAGATRVVTDAGWMPPDRQIGTTGVTVHPDLYVALGVSGASQHTGGLGDPGQVVSVNTDPACPMTAMADLGIVADARGLLVELARRLRVQVPDILDAPDRGPAETGAL
jgi:electron transfer flavoprotein alpha subunit